MTQGIAPPASRHARVSDGTLVRSLPQSGQGFPVIPGVTYTGWYNPVDELDKSVQGKRQALERSNAEALEKIQEAMLKIITGIAKDRKANLVFQRSELVLFDQGFDVTDEVLAKLDEQLPTLTVNFAAPVAASANGPAAAGQTQPAADKQAPKKKK